MIRIVTITTTFAAAAVHIRVVAAPSYTYTYTPSPLLAHSSCLHIWSKSVLWPPDRAAVITILFIDPDLE
jgi:hypothetical protein